MDAIAEPGDEGAMSITDHGLAELSEEGRRLWTAALALNRNRPGVSLGTLPPLLFFTDPERIPNPWATVERLPAGAGVVYRHFGAKDAHETAVRLRQVTADRAVRLLVGLDVELAVSIAADGVHLPERALERTPELRQGYPDWLITGAFHGGTHPAPEILEALDALVVSPVFATASSSPARPPLGAGGIRRLAADLARPVYALGGVSLETVESLADCGLCGLAGVEAFDRAFSG